MNGIYDKERGVVLHDTVDYSRVNSRAELPVRKEGARYITEERRGGLYRIGARWLCRYRIGDVPLNAMRSAVYNKLPINAVWSSMNYVSNAITPVSPLCQLCNIHHNYDDYGHVIFDCPAFERERTSLLPHINSARDIIHDAANQLILSFSSLHLTHRTTVMMMVFMLLWMMTPNSYGWRAHRSQMI